MSRFHGLNHRWRRMRGAVQLHRPAGQQQTQDDAENQLFLFRQVIHAANIAESAATGNNAIYDL